ncbi:trypsin-like serine protease [Spiractinospora alimapuensis]|uniref:S1 family peptidase n=1 Tax=Spiractinospora alimapuensis TaxID=2820884 RepID=UPI001F162ECF|nr:S1 family peptidase [Spiractinospora alimapuensis]QVQ54065.1 trypsin-like serine protease [Spiractinospora alimapuensis]
MRTTTDNRKRLWRNGAIALVTLVALVAVTIVGVNFLWKDDSAPEPTAQAENTEDAPEATEDADEDAEESTEDYAATPEEALTRDLQISPAEAEEVFPQQASAEEIRAGLEASLGDAYGGAVYDIDSDTLTVSVTDESAVDEVEAAGAEARVVDHGRTELASAASGIETAETSSVYVDEADDSIVVEVPEGAEDDAESIASASGIDPSMVRVDRAEEYVTFEPAEGDVVGGFNYYINNESRCSVGFAVTGADGQGGFATAGHCGNEGDTTTEIDGSFAGSDFPGADMAWVSTDAPLTNLVHRYDTGGYVEVSGSQEAPIGAAVCRSGYTTGWNCGLVQAFDSTVNYAQGQVDGLTRTSACAEPGDSGGSFISGAQAQGVTSGGNGNCDTGGTTFFQPINPILDAYGLDLVTEAPAGDGGDETTSEDAETDGDEDEVQDDEDEDADTELSVTSR